MVGSIVVLGARAGTCSRLHIYGFVHYIYELQCDVRFGCCMGMIDMHESRWVVSRLGSWGVTRGAYGFEFLNVYIIIIIFA